MQIQESDIEKAIAFCLDPSTSRDPAVKSEALAYCESLKTTASALKPCIHVLLESRSLECKFFCLQVLEHQTKHQISPSPVLLEATRVLLLPNLCNWFGTVAPSVPTYMKNKIAAVLALLVKHLYLQPDCCWKDAFEQIISFTVSRGNPEVFLRFCIAFDEEVICLSMNRSVEETCKNTAIKDEMRLADVERLFRVWMMLLKEQNQDLLLTDLVFKVLSLYLSWIDSQYLGEALLIQAIREAIIPGNSRFSQIRPSVTATLCTVICKGMPCEGKIQFFERWKIFDLVQAIFPHFSTASNGGTDQMLMAKILTNLGLELCACMHESLDGQRAFLLANVQLVFNLAVELLERSICKREINVVELTLELTPLFSDFIDLLKQMLKRKVTPCPTLMETAKRILSLVLQLSCYPSDYDFDNVHGDFELSFHELRSVLGVFLDNLYPILGDYYLAFTRQYILEALTSSGTSGKSHNSSIQTALWLIFRYAEVTKCLPAYVSKQTLPGELIEMISLMITNAPSLFKSPQMNPETLFLFFDILLRYSQYGYFNSAALGMNQLPQVVELFAQALNQSERLREQLASPMAKFIKAQREKLVANSSLCQSLATALMPFLTISKEQLEEPAEATNSFYEIIGILLKGFPDQKAVLEGISQSIYRESCSNSNSTKANVHFLVNATMAVGSLCKGIPEADAAAASEQILPTLTCFCEFVMQVLKQFHSLPSARKAAAFFVQRASLVTGQAILPFVASFEREIVEFGELGEISESLSLLSSIMHRHERSVIPFYGAFVKELMEKIFWFFVYFAPQGTDDAFGLACLKRSYLSWSCSLFGANCASLLAGEESVFSLFLRGVTAMCADWSDCSIQKQAFNLMTRAIDLWMPSEQPISTEKSSEEMPSFDLFVFQQFFPLALSTLADSRFVYADGQCSLLLTEILSMFKAALRKQLSPSMQMLKNLMLQSQCADDSSVQEFVRGMRDYEVKQLKTLVAAIFNKSK